MSRTLGAALKGRVLRPPGAKRRNAKVNAPAKVTKPNARAERDRRWRLARNRARLYALGGALGVLMRSLEKSFGGPRIGAATGGAFGARGVIR